MPAKQPPIKVVRWVSFEPNRQNGRVTGVGTNLTVSRPDGKMAVKVTFEIDPSVFDMPLGEATISVGRDNIGTTVVVDDLKKLEEELR